MLQERCVRGRQRWLASGLPDELPVFVGVFVFQGVRANFGRPFNIPPELHVKAVSSRCVEQLSLHAVALGSRRTK